MCTHICRSMASFLHQCSAGNMTLLFPPLLHLSMCKYTLPYTQDSERQTDAQTHNWHFKFLLFAVCLSPHSEGKKSCLSSFHYLFLLLFLSEKQLSFLSCLPSFSYQSLSLSVSLLFLISAPQAKDVDHGEPCPLGHFCPRGTKTPEPCPASTGGKSLKLTSKDECTPCLVSRKPGVYIHQTNLEFLQSIARETGNEPIKKGQVILLSLLS